MGARGIPGELLKATDANGISGFGFLIEHGGLPQFSIAWPDKPASRMTYDMADRMGVVIKPALLMPARTNVQPPSVSQSKDQQPITEQLIVERPNTEQPDGEQPTIPAALDPQVSASLDQSSDLLKLYPGISSANLRLLQGAGLTTRADVAEFYATHRSLSTPIKGIGPKGEAEILAALGIPV